MFDLKNTKNIFSFFFRTGFRSKRTKIFFFFTLIPFIVLLIIKILETINPASSLSAAQLFPQIGASFYFQLFIPLVALFYGSSVINDELEDKTLIYLTTSPVSKATILLGKLLANLATAMLIIAGGIVISFMVSHLSTLLEFVIFKQMLIFLGVATIATLAYSTLFALMGTLFKKSVLLGILFIFGWESIVQFFPGTTQKFTITHFVKSLLPHNLQQKGGFLQFRLQPSSTVESILILLSLSLVFTAVAIFIFYKKEYLLSENV